MANSSPRAVDSLALPVAQLPGIGGVRGAALRQAGILTVEDLLRNVPRRYLDRSRIPRIGDITRRPTRVREGKADEVTLVGTVERMQSIPGRTRRTLLALTDGTGRLSCVWFGRADWLERAFSPGDLVAVSGKLSWFRGLQMTHPDIELVGESADDLIHVGRIIPVYAQSGVLSAAGLTSRGMRRVIRRVLDRLAASIPDPLPDELRERHGLLSLPRALNEAHFPTSFPVIERARERLVFDEFFALELALARRKRHLAAGEGVVFPLVGPTFERLLARLPFDLTAGQKRVLKEIRRDMKRARPMSRLLQGDVGSGKTLVAVFSAVMAADNGYQTAIMAPTEVLAEQHASIIGRLLFEVGVDCLLLTGSTPAAQRRDALGEIATGQVPVVIGTHALLSDDVRFHRLGLVIVDEQHRFGVVQREALRRKGAENAGSRALPDLLVMTATPIPRSLAQTLFGDLDVSFLREKPPGRQAVRTILCPANRPESAWEALREAIGRGEQGYVVFPMINESDRNGLKAAKTGFEALRTGPFRGSRLALLHGRMKANERDRVMTAFKAGQIDVLVSTTVIEVGVDVPNATAMVIEGAERFGLSQLHQLRGRIGRGVRLSECYLVPGTDELSPEAERRLAAIAKTEDGFALAEEDLLIRGPGEFFGTRQSGLPEFRIAHLVRDAATLTLAREEAFSLVERDPDFRAPEHRELRRLVEPFERAFAEMEARTVA